MEKHDSIWQHYGYGHGQRRRTARFDVLALCVLAGILTITSLCYLESSPRWLSRLGAYNDLDKAHVLAQCAALKLPAGPSPDFHARTSSDRFEPGTRSTLITNATIWTGMRGGKEVVTGSILLDRGLVKAIGTIPPNFVGNDVEVMNVGGSWVTPGLGE